MKEVPSSHQDLIKDETRSFAFLATTVKDGYPQVTPVWFNYKDGYFYINSAKGRLKDRNMRERPGVAFAIPDPTDPYRYLQVRGMVVEITEEGAAQHITDLSFKYRGKPYQIPAGQARVIYKIEPTHIFADD